MKKKVVSALATAAIVSGACAATASADTYTVQKGDSLSVIAHKYHTSVGDLQKFNNLSSDLILINQKLQLPNTNSQAAAPASSAPATTAYYTVVKGDTLSQIAQHASISLSNLKQWNSLTSDLIFPGQQLKIAAGTSAQPAVAKPATVSASSSYLIQSGDTLSKIAKQFSTTVAALQQLNGLSSDRIYAGKTIKVSGTVTKPAAVSSTPAASAPKATPVSAPAVKAAAPASGIYVVESGDTLGKIAGQFGTTVSNLKNLNGLKSDLIFVGQKLTVSGQAKPAAISSASSTPKPTTASAPSDQTPSASMVTLTAKSLLGKPYVWGGTTPSGFDCSGFIYYVFNKAGYSIGRYTASGYYNRSYEVDKPVPGDLVFFKDTYASGISHVGIYLGNNQFISAVDETKGVAISNLNSSYNQAHFDSFKRFY